MSEHMVVVDLNTICRFCMECKGALSSIFEGSEEPSLPEQIASFSDIIIEPHEFYPPNVCHRCRTKIEQCFEFKLVLSHSQSLFSENFHVFTSKEEQCTSESIVKIKQCNNYIVSPQSTQDKESSSNLTNEPTCHVMENESKVIEEGETIKIDTEKKYRFSKSENNVEKKNKPACHEMTSKVLKEGETIELNTKKKYIFIVKNFNRVDKGTVHSECPISKFDNNVEKQCIEPTCYGTKSKVLKEGKTIEIDTRKEYTSEVKNFNGENQVDINSKCISKSENNLDKNNDQKFVTEINQNDNILTEFKKNQCLLCLENLNDRDSLHGHIDHHVEGTHLDAYYKIKDRQMYCKLCEKTFEYRFVFLNDQRQHLGIKPFICRYENCSSTFYSNAALRHHLPMHADRKFICSTCGLRFKRKSDLKSHEIIHEDANVEFHCALCGMLCKNRLTYAAHVRKHQNQPRFKCDHCHKDYFSRSELARHLNIHSTEKKFKCEMCSSAYYSQSALNRHKKHHFKNDTLKDATDNSFWNKVLRKNIV